MTIKLFATDLDGTLLRPDHTVSDFTRDTIRRAVDAGIKVVFATGRPTRWLPPVVEETMHSDLIIAANGSLIIDAVSRDVVDIWEIDKNIGDGKPGPVTMKMRKALLDIQTGQARDEHNWMYRLA